MSFAVHWPAVAFGWLVDFALKLLLQLVLFWFGLAAFYQQPTLSEPVHWIAFALLLFAPALGGFVAARLAEEAFWLNGLMVGLVAILAGAVANPRLIAVPPLLLLAQLLGCLLAVIGGLIAGHLHQHTTASSD